MSTRTITKPAARTSIWSQIKPTRPTTKLGWSVLISILAVALYTVATIILAAQG